MTSCQVRPRVKHVRTTDVENAPESRTGSKYTDIFRGDSAIRQAPFFSAKLWAEWPEEKKHPLKRIKEDKPVMMMS